MPRELPRLEKGELFARLAEGHAARITLLTPNRRLAQALQGDFARAQRGRGLAAWETADILPFGAFVERLWEDALYSEVGADVPVLLTPAQEAALWEEAIHAGRFSPALLSAAFAAQQCREAWRLAHGWRLLGRRKGPVHEDAQAFFEWAARYEAATADRRQVDGARLPDVVRPLLANSLVRKPATLVLYGFDIVTPQMRDFIDALGALGCALSEAHPPERRADATRVEFSEAKREIEAAARWARTRLEAQPAARIGVIVPDLARLRALVRRAFANALQPSQALPGAHAASAFNMSLGRPLADEPLVADALAVLALAGREAPFEDVSRLVRSPFLAAGEAEAAARARLDVRLRERCRPQVTLDTLVRLARSESAPRAPKLVELLERLATLRKASLFGAHAPPQWARAFSDALRAVGFPGERTLDSHEFQTLEKWHDALAQFARLDRVSGKMGHAEAHRRLVLLARDTIFQPDRGEAPVQVVGILESAGLEFDHLWITGLTDDAWPLAAQPHPFLPVGAQRSAGVPQADPVSSLELDRRITQGWMRAAGEVVVSHARMKGESEVGPSPLIESVAPATLEDLAVGAFRTLREAVHAGGRVETIDDARTSAIGEGLHTGGTGLFRDQAACPFRAVAKYRLAAKPLETPRSGLAATDRGTVVHAMLAAVWTALGTRQRLEATAPGELTALLEKCADEALGSLRRYRAEKLAGRFEALERARLVALARDWLAAESRRPDFEVVAIEEKRPLTFGGVTVNAKLDRMDPAARRTSCRT